MRSNRRLLPLALSVLLPFALGGCGGYANHLAAWESNRPPAYLTATPAAEPAPLAPTPEAATIPLPALSEESEPETRLSLPAPALIAAMAPAGNDLNFTAGKLAGSFTLSELEALALWRSPELRAAEEEYRGVLERYSQSESLNDLLGRYAAFTKADKSGLYPFPGSVALRGEIVRQEAAVARETREITRRNLLAKTRRAFWELLFARQAQTTAVGEYDVADSLKNTAATGYASGGSPFQELVQVGIGHGQMKEAIPIRLEEVRVKEEAVRALLDLPVTVAIGAPAEMEPIRPPPLLTEITAIALATRQELRILRHQITKTELLIALTENETHPGYSLNLSAFPAPDSGQAAAASPNNPFSGLYEGYLRETRQTLAALRHRLAAEEAQTRSLVREGWYQVDRAGREERLAREKIVPLSLVALETASAAYSAGQGNFAQLLDAYAKWFAATLAGRQTQANLGSAWATLEEKVGAQLAAPPPPTVTGQGN